MLIAAHIFQVVGAICAGIAFLGLLTLGVGIIEAGGVGSDIDREDSDE